MPPRVKKGGLSNEQIQQTVDLVKQYWPHYQINLASIKNPTKAFIIKLYSDCVQNLEEKLAFATRTQILSNAPGLSEEDLLYLKLKQIPSLAETDFKLGDLFVFDPIRVNSHIYIIMHFLMMTDSMMDKTVQIGNSVFDAQEKVMKDKEELKELKQDKLNKQIQLTQVKTEKKKLKEEAAAIQPGYEATMILIKEMELKCKDKIEEMQKLNSELANLEIEAQKLEKTQMHLKSQIVTEEEYLNLKANLESLENQDKNLEEIDLSNGLVQQKEHMEHLQMCLRELNHMKLGEDEDIFKLSAYRAQLKDEEESLQYAQNLQKNNESVIKAMKLQLENEKQSVEMREKEFENQLRLLTEEGMLLDNNLKRTYQKLSDNNQIKITEQHKVLETREADHLKLQEDLKQKYESICEKQDKALQRLKDFIDRVENAFKERKVVHIIV